jgi:hypothetical protein
LTCASYAAALRQFTNLPDWDERRRCTGVAFCLEALAGVLAPTHPERAAKLWSGSQALLASVGRAAVREFDVAYPLPRNPAAADRMLEVVHATLDDTAFDAACGAGQALTLDQAIGEAFTWLASAPSEQSAAS